MKSTWNMMKFLKLAVITIRDAKQSDVQDNSIFNCCKTKFHKELAQTCFRFIQGYIFSRSENLLVFKIYTY